MNHDVIRALETVVGCGLGPAIEDNQYHRLLARQKGLTEFEIAFRRNVDLLKALKFVLVTDRWQEKPEVWARVLRGDGDDEVGGR